MRPLFWLPLFLIFGAVVPSLSVAQARLLLRAPSQAEFIQPVPRAEHVLADSRIDTLRSPEIPPFPYAKAAAYGTGMGALGWLAGISSAALLARGGALGDDYNTLRAISYAGIAGASLAIPHGTWLADRRRGDRGAALLAAFAIGAGGVLVAHSNNDLSDVLYVVPVSQIVSSILIGRHTRK